MARLLALLLAGLLAACAPAQRQGPSQAFTIPAHGEQEARRVRDVARAWLLGHGYGVLDKRNDDHIVYVLKSDQDVEIALQRTRRHPTLLSLRLSRRGGGALHPAEQAQFGQLTAAVRAAVKKGAERPAP